MTLDTTRRILFAIPSPQTEMTIGQFFEKTRTDERQTVTTQFSGVSVYTAADIRFNAHGSWTSSTKQSDLIAQSKGQLWIQAIGKVVGLAGADMWIVSPEATMIAGQGGVTILAGFRPSSIVPEPEAGTFPSAVSRYDSTSKIPTVIWGIFDTVMAIGLTALDIYLTIADRPSGKSGFNAWGILGGLANVAGAAINIAGLTGSSNVTLPGINMFAQAGMLIGSALGSVNIIGVPGVLLASTFTTQYALLGSSVRGLFSAGMSSFKTADVSAILDVTVRASDELMMASRTGDVSARGAMMNIGKAVPKPGTPQPPTIELKLLAVKEVALESMLRLKLDAMTGISSKAAVESTIDGGAKVRFKTGAFEISMGPVKTTIGSKAGAKITLDDMGAKVEGAGGVAKVELTATAIDIVAGAGSCKFDIAGKKLTVDGTEFSIK